MAGVIPQPQSNKGAAVSQPNSFGAPVNDANRTPITKSSWFQTNDITATNNLQSPLALTTTIVDIKVPLNAVTVTFIADGITRISEQATQGQYMTVPANTPITFDVARQSDIYVAAATTANLSFAFQTM